MTVDRRFAPRPKPHRTAVVAHHCRERRPARKAAGAPLAVRGLEGATLDTGNLHAIKESVVSALVLGDHGHIQLVMADLRVKAPKAWAEVDQLLASLRAFEHAPPRAPVVGTPQRTTRIERNLHRFWAGGPMPAETKRRLLEMQAVVNESASSATPWQQLLWTSGLVNDGRRLDDELVAAGIRIVDVDEQFKPLHVEANGMRWALEARDRRVKRTWLARTVGLIAVSAYGGVYLDAGIGPGTLSLSNNQLYHTDPSGEIGHHGPPFRGPLGYADVVGDAALGDSERERIARFADASLPVVGSFFASRSGTEHLIRELAHRFQQRTLTDPASRFGQLFVSFDEALSRYAPPQQRVTPWAADLAWA
jgi:hypothetical protein